MLGASLFLCMCVFVGVLGASLSLCTCVFMGVLGASLCVCMCVFVCEMERKCVCAKDSDVFGGFFDSKF